MTKAAAVAPKNLPLLALRDSLTGQQVEVPVDKNGKPDFFVAGLALRKLRNETPKKTPASTPVPDPKLKAAEQGLKAAQADYAKARKAYQAAAGAYEKAQQATVQAKTKHAKPAVIAKFEKAEKKAKDRFVSAEGALRAYRTGLDFSRQAYDKLKKAGHKAPAYEYATAAWGAFGKKYPKQYGTPRIVIALHPIVKPAPGATKSMAVKPSGKPAAKPKVPAASKPAPKISTPSTAPAVTPPAAAKPSSPPAAAKPPVPPVPSAAPKAEVKAEPTPKPESAPLPKNSPGQSKETPIYYSQVESKDGKLLIHTAEGKTMSFPTAGTKYQDHGGGLSSLHTPEGQTYWFQSTGAVEDLGGDAGPGEAKVAAKSPPPPPPSAVEAPKPPAVTAEPAKSPLPPATAETPSPPPPASTGSAPSALSGISDAEAAEYTQPVSGYPTEKAPLYVWKHKTEKKFLAVGNGKRIPLTEAQFHSLDIRAHPELYAKAPTPPPKSPGTAPKPATTPDF